MKNFFSDVEKNISKQVKSIGKGIADFDKDRVPNYKDCQPLNPKKHGVEPSTLMEQRIRKLPIYVTDKVIPRVDGKFKDISDIYDKIKYNIYHFLKDPRARKKAPIARKTILSVLKKYPEVITQLERKRPRMILVTSKPDPKNNTWGLAYPIKRGRGLIVIYALSKKLYLHIKEIGKAQEIKKPIAAGIGGTLRHELEHIKQFRGAATGKTSYRKMERGEYEERPIEKEAERARKRMQSKHEKEREFDIEKILF